MKKTFILFMLILLSVSFTTAQEVFWGSGKLTVTPYIAGPNLTDDVMITYARRMGFYNFSHSSIPCFGFRLERISRKGLGFTFEASYTRSKAEFTISDLTRSIVFKSVFPQFRIMYGNNYHLGNSAKYDWYLGYCLGWHSGDIDIQPKEHNSGYIEDMHDPIAFRFHDYEHYLRQRIDFTTLPISFRLHFGTNISLTNRIGLNLELGSFGGGLVKVGANIKLHE